MKMFTHQVFHFAFFFSFLFVDFVRLDDPSEKLSSTENPIEPLSRKAHVSCCSSGIEKEK